MQNPREFFLMQTFTFLCNFLATLTNSTHRASWGYRSQTKSNNYISTHQLLPCSVEPSDERPSPFVVNIPLIFLFRRVRHWGLMNGTPRLCHRYFLKSRRLQNKVALVSRLQFLWTAWTAVSSVCLRFVCDVY